MACKQQPQRAPWRLHRRWCAAQLALSAPRQSSKPSPPLPRPASQAIKASPDGLQAELERQLEAERQRLATLRCEEAALAGMASYQQDAIQVLQFANLADQLGGEVTFEPAEGTDEGSQWAAAYASCLVPIQDVEESLEGSVLSGSNSVTLQRGTDQAPPAGQAAAGEPSSAAAGQAAAGGPGSGSAARGATSSSSGGGGSRGSRRNGSAGGREGGTADCSASGAAGSAKAPAHSTVAGAAASAAAAAPSGGAGAPTSSGGAAATGGSAPARSGGRGAASGSPLADRLGLQGEDRGLLERLMQEQRVTKFWYDAGSDTVRATFMR